MTPGSRRGVRGVGAKALPILDSAAGCFGGEFRRQEEDGSNYLLLIRWTSVEAHMAWRETEDFPAVARTDLPVLRGTTGRHALPRAAGALDSASRSRTPRATRRPPHRASPSRQRRLHRVQHVLRAARGGGEVVEGRAHGVVVTRRLERRHPGDLGALLRFVDREDVGLGRVTLLESVRRRPRPSRRGRPVERTRRPPTRSRLACSATRWPRRRHRAHRSPAM